MDIELAPIESIVEEQSHFDDSKIASESWNQPTTPHAPKRWEKPNISYNLSKSRRWFCSYIRSNAMRGYASFLFISLCITVGVLVVYFAAPRPNKICRPSFKRMMQSSLIFTSQPRFGVTADLNNDQQMDIVVANSGTNTIGIFFSQANQSFAKQQTYSTGPDSRPYSVAISHFNRDNYLDIAVANYGTNEIGIFLGNGNGTFEEQKVFSLGNSRPMFLTNADLNEDNRMDLVVVNYGTNTIGILLGYGNGSFPNQTTYFLGYDSIPHALAVADLNNDHHLDIAVANYGIGNITIFLGKGNGTFVSLQTYTTLPRSNPTSIAIADVNNDTYLDVAVSNNGPGMIGIFLGHGNGTFQAQETYSLGSNSQPQYLALGDLNKDNVLDIIVVDSQNDRVHILPGYGNGSFPIITTYDVVSRSHPFGVVVADFDNDKQSDVALINYGTSNVLVLTGYDEKPSVTETIYYDGQEGTVRSLVVSDFNNDRILDIGFTANGVMRVFIGLGNGTFDRKTINSNVGASRTEYICIADLNNNTWIDIIGANGGDNTVSVLLGQGDGKFAAMTPLSTGNDSSPQWVAVADVNNDDRLDIVSANAGANIVGIFINNGDGSFAPMVAYPTVVGMAPYSVAIGDIDNDNNLDLVIADNNDIAIFFLGHGDGTVTFANQYSANGDSNPIAIALADLNSDNNLDIVMTNRNANNLGIFLGYGNGTFAEQATYSADSGFKPYFVVIADFNNDNISDLATTNVGNSEVDIFYGYGNGSFELRRIYPTGYGSIPIGIAVADFDDNKQLELVVVLWGTGDIAVLTEYDAAKFVHQMRYSTGSAPQPLSVTAGDLNNDNRSDIIVANSGLDNLGLLLNLDNNTFDMNITYSLDSDSYPQYVITCDVNQDNQLDLVSVNSKMNSISVIIGHGNGTFEDQRLYPTGDSSNPDAVAAGDFNNDSRLDLVIANEGADSIGILFGFNYTSFQRHGTYSNNNSLGTTGVVVLDLNNDTFLDIAAVFETSNILGILFGDGTGNFTTMISYSTGNNSNPSDMVVEDLNNDNYLDIVTAHVGAGTVGVFLGDSGGNFNAARIYSTGNDSVPYSVAVGDFNNDDCLDIVVANGKDSNIGVLLSYGNGSFSVVQTYFTGKGSHSSAVAIGDFNSDGYFDIAVTNHYTHNVGIFLGYGDGTFADQKIFSTSDGTAPVDLFVADLNNDHRLDIATANWNASVSVFSLEMLCRTLWFGDGSFLLGKPYSTDDGSQPFALGIGDFNNDRRLDVAVGNNFAGNIAIFLANGTEPFGSIKAFSTNDSSQPHSVTIGDLNNDDRLDIIVANYGTDSVGVFLAGKHGNFGEMEAYALGYGSAPSSVAVADLNNDTHLDIAASNSESDNIAILLGYGNGTFAIGKTHYTGARSRPYTVAIGDFNDDNIPDLVIANSGTNNILFSMDMETEHLEMKLAFL